jgi:hypothetical protein
MKSSIAWTAKDGPKTDRLEVAGGGDISSFLEVHWTLKEGDTLIKHQPVGVKTLARTMCSVRWGGVEHWILRGRHEAVCGSLSNV